MSRFATSIQCMDGRIQLTLLTWLRDTFGVPYIDSITEPGPCRILAEDRDLPVIESIYRRVAVSVDHHHSRQIAVSGHYDCTANPVSRSVQVEQLRVCEVRLKARYPGLEIVPLWVDESFRVERV